MKLFVTLLLALFASGSVFAKGLSAHRHFNETYEEARARHYFSQIFDLPIQGGAAGALRSITAESAKKPLKNLNINDLPNVGSYPDLENQFFYIRDTRFLTTENPAFPRRLTWLYPDDGCYARAEVAKIEIAEHGFMEPKKVFVFGNLSANSDNSPTGSVQWWYHVAAAYRVGSEAYVLDPALEPHRPLKLAEWNERVGGTHAYVQYSICDKDAYDPNSDCYRPTPLSRTEALYEQKGFLQDEWDRLLELKRNPEKELGDFPPWLDN